MKIKKQMQVSCLQHQIVFISKISLIYSTHHFNEIEMP